MADMNRDGVIAYSTLLIPHIGIDILSREHSAPVSDKQFQDFVLHGGKSYGLSVNLYRRYVGCIYQRSTFTLYDGKR